jgi:hypothetical protein
MSEPKPKASGPRAGKPVRDLVPDRSSDAYRGVDEAHRTGTRTDVTDLDDAAFRRKLAEILPRR